MKREYSKPTIHVEVLSLDMPVAITCDTAFKLEFPELQEMKWFVSDQNCIRHWGDDQALVDEYGNTFCYHSHTRTIFGS